MAKKIGSTIYVHKSNIQELLDMLPDDWYKTAVIYKHQRKQETGGYPYEIIKYDIKQHKLSFIDSPNWNSCFEPTVGVSEIWNLDTGKLTIRKPRKNNPQIYHQRYLFVSYDYNGFDVEADFQRRRYYEQFLTKEDAKRIGNYDYWKQFCEKHGIDL